MVILRFLVNGRPIFSPLTGLYGMEQIPVNMIDRIEIVKGGGEFIVWIFFNWWYC